MAIANGKKGCGCITIIAIVFTLGAIIRVTETLNLSAFQILLGLFCIIFIAGILNYVSGRGRNIIPPAQKIGIGVILAILIIVVYIFGGKPAKPTKHQPKQSSSANEKDRLIYTDSKTGLMWPINGNIAGKKMDWVEAMLWVKDLNYAGYNDWRLPTKVELESLSQRCGDRASEWLNANGFNNLQSDLYWTSSTCTDKTDDAWGVKMSDSVKGHYFTSSKKFNGVNVWPVRGFSTEYGTVLEQQNEYERELQKAKEEVARIEAKRIKEIEEKERRIKMKGTVSTVDNRFVFSYMTVHDKRTGLIWTRDANLEWLNWHDSFKFIKELNKNNYAGHKDWRLPSEKELLTLISYAKSRGHADPSGVNGPSMLFNQMGFYDVQHGHINYMSGYYYLTSNTDSRQTGYARVVSMYNGYAYSTYKAEKHYVWPVRSDR